MYTLNVYKNNYITIRSIFSFSFLSLGKTYKKTKQNSCIFVRPKKRIKNNEIIAINFAVFPTFLLPIIKKITTKIKKKNGS